MFYYLQIIASIENNYLNLGKKTGVGRFEYVIHDLSFNQQYFVRTWAKNDELVVYGLNTISFTTLIPALSNVGNSLFIHTDHTSAYFSIEIMDSSGVENVQKYGFCWTTQAVPLSDKQNEDEISSEDLSLLNADNYTEHNDFVWDGENKSYNSKVENLKSLTKYYIRSYVTIEKTNLRNSRRN